MTYSRRENLCLCWLKGPQRSHEHSFTHLFKLPPGSLTLLFQTEDHLIRCPLKIRLLDDGTASSFRFAASCRDRNGRTGTSTRLHSDPWGGSSSDCIVRTDDDRSQWMGLPRLASSPHQNYYQTHQHRDFDEKLRNDLAGPEPFVATTTPRSNLAGCPTRNP